MRTAKIFLLGLGVGSGATFFFDPQKGPRRRALMRDQAIHVAGEVREHVDAGLRDLGHRLHGMMSSATGFVHALSARSAVPDDVVQARVRSALGHVCSHPHAIHVTVDQGCVELTGVVLNHERASVIRHLSRVRGVSLVKDLLEAHTHEDAIPMLQGPPRRARPALVRGLSSPAGRLVVGSAVLMALGSLAPVLLLPMGTMIGLGVAARKDEQARARRTRSLERRGARRTRPTAGSAPHASITTPAAHVPASSANGHSVGASPTGHTRPVPPRPQ
ncbi:MAG TPA: hypothetical protein VNO21_14505 [Polyangiaceae bacterium]|nr:hypothetical protein [Polyangiaceae bacterium]